jgi:TolB protein
MKQDEELRTRLDRAAEGLRFDAGRSLERFRASRARRHAVRRGATVALALAVAAVGLSVAWIARPAGSPAPGPSHGTAGSQPTGPVTPTGPVRAGPEGTIGFMRATQGGESAVAETASVSEGGTPVPIGTATYSVDPVWSPDGTRLAYGAGAELGRTELMVTDGNGDGARRVADAPGFESVSWSPDGTRIAYIDEGGNQVHVIGADGTGDALILRGLWQSVSWSPDGGRLLIAGHPQTKDGNSGEAGFDIATVRPDGSDLVALAHEDGYEQFATWSPDGGRILFTRSPGFESYAQDVYVMDADGSNERQLTDWRGVDSFPAWSPDGSWIAFASDRDAPAGARRANEASQTLADVSMYVMRADGSDVRRVLAAARGEALLPSSWRT